MGWGNHHDDHHDYGKSNERVTDYIRQRLGSSIGASSDHKEIAREISDRFGVLLTPSEVKEIHQTGEIVN
jgi:hypothetical protein